jgi:hypothetical protein
MTLLTLFAMNRLLQEAQYNRIARRALFSADMVCVMHELGFGLRRATAKAKVNRRGR